MKFYVWAKPINPERDDVIASRSETEDEVRQKIIEYEFSEAQLNRLSVSVYTIVPIGGTANVP